MSKKKTADKRLHLQVRNLKPQFAPKVEKPHESEAAVHGDQDGRCSVPGGVGRLPGAPKPALPGLVYTNTSHLSGALLHKVSGREIQ